jgi:hypothetical protein
MTLRPPGLKELHIQPTSDRYKSLDDKPYDSFYLYVDTVIDYPVERVWPHALNIGRWMSAHRLDRIEGEPGQVGFFERVYPVSLASTVPEPRYHLYGIAEIIAPKLIALEVFPENGGSYGNTRPKMSFDTIFLTDLGDRTHVGFYMVDVHLGEGDEQSHVRRKAELEGGVRELLMQYFENLRREVTRGG